MKPITWEEYKAFMLLYHNTDFSEQGDTVRFFREQAVKTGRAESTLRNMANGNNRPKFRERFMREYKIGRKQRKVTVKPMQPPTRKEMQGVIINHQIMRRQWV